MDIQTWAPMRKVNAKEMTKNEQRENLLTKMRSEYPSYRDEMTKGQERKFVEDMFEFYELEGFAKLFWSPYGDFPNYHGKPFQVLGREPEFPKNKNGVDLDCLPMWNIRFPDGHEMAAYPEEIIPSEMRDNGCPASWFEEN